MMIKPKHLKRRIMLATFLCLIISALYCYWENNRIGISESVYSNPKLPAEFQDFTIAHISDLHNKSFGKDQKYILHMLKSIEPNIIVVTGDLIDRRKYDLDVALTFVEGASKIAPVYYVTGNHEAWLDDFETAKLRLIGKGAIFLDDSQFELTRKGGTIKLMGLSDPDFLTTSYGEGNDVTLMTKQLADWKNDNSFKILLTHRPELFELYAKNNMDLIFAGHAHGGQIRIPFIGAVIAPEQGFLPDLTEGRYNMGNSTLYVSRGLGNSLLPIRINNRPEIVVVRLSRI